jgi:hypothetical protein
MEDDLQRRLAANEAVFREVNDGIKRGQWPGEENAQAGFRCECARLGCNALLTLSPREYEHVRAHSRRFVMIPGHQIPEVDTVVETQTDYVVVEKRDEAGRAAEVSDPRT